MNTFTLTASLLCPVTRRRLGAYILLPAAFLTVGLAGCSETSAKSSSNGSTVKTETKTETKTADKTSANSLLLDAVFAKSLGKNQEPENPSNDFYPTETIHLSLKFKGRPSKGVVATKFYLGDQLISEAKVDVADVNSGVLFSVGEATYTGFSLKPTRALPVGDKYRAESSFDNQPLGTYKFRVVPPADAIASKITEATFAKGVDKDRVPVEPMTEFPADQPVYLAARGDLGTGSGVEVNWYVNGELDKAGTKSLTASKNLPDTRFYFTFRPAGGWKPGKQEAVLMLNGTEAGRYAFTIK